VSVVGADAMARQAEAATLTVRDPVLSAELSGQARAWRDVASVIQGHESSGERITGDLPSYVRKLSVLVTSDEPHLAGLAESALRRLALTRSEELIGSGTPVALVVTAAHRSGRDAVTITLAVPPVLRDQFAGQAGQHLPLHAEVGGVPLRRSYSLLRAPRNVHAQGTVSIAVRREQRGRVSGQMVDQCRAGDFVVVSPPAGVFCPPDDVGHLLLLGAGSGVVPLIALAEDWLGRDPGNRVTLVQVERRREDVMGLDLLDDLTRTSGSRLVLHVVETSSMGRPDVQRLTELAVSMGLGREPFSDARVCGPHAFTDAACAAAIAAGIHPERVLRESFVTHSLARRVRPGGVVTVDLDDEQVQLAVGPGESILAALLRSGRDHPYSCLSGTCGSCALRVVAGAVAPTAPVVLGTPRTESGWVLSCQAAPL
jgi:ferredoxin-NADP reductase